MKRPNIVFLMTDQHRWDALGCVNPAVRTPHLDQLASEGIRYDQATANAAICVPSRYSLMTGLYPSQSGLRFNRQICPTDADLPCSVIPQEMQQAGYQTAGFGKTHWYDSKLGAEPRRRGFEIRAVFHEGREHIKEEGANYMEDDYPDGVRFFEEHADICDGGECPDGYIGKTSKYGGGEQREGWATRKAIDFLENQRDEERPFFLYLSLDFPHAPSIVPPGYESQYNVNKIADRIIAEDLDSVQDHYDFKDGEMREAWLKLTPNERRIATLRYYALCTYADDCFGQLINKLKSTGDYDNTTFVFCSDHGEMLGDRNHRFSKYCLYEGSIRVPLIISGASIPPEKRGTIDTKPVELVDILPTLQEIVNIPDDPCRPGISLFSDVVRSGSYAEFHGSGYDAEQDAPTLMWRTEKWKLILSVPGKLTEARFSGNFQGELYHLTEDPVELVNRFEEPDCKEQKHHLTMELLRHLTCQNAAWPRKTTDVTLSSTEINQPVLAEAEKRSL